MKTAIPPLLATTDDQLARMGERLRLARLRRSIGVNELAAMTGLSRVTVFRVEKGVASVAFGAYARVMEALGLVDDLEFVARQDVVGRQRQDGLLASRRAKTPPGPAPETAVVREPAQAMWQFKRRNQRQDLDAIEGRKASNQAMSWFTEEQAAGAVIVGEPL